MSQATLYATPFQANRAALIELYEQLPEEQAHFAAWDGGLSFMALADHLSGSLNRFLGLVRGEVVEAVAPSTTLAEATARLQKSQDAALASINALSDEDLDRQVVALGGREMPVRDILSLLTLHEAHHKGQAWMMARMVGIKPPRFIKMS